MPENRHPNFHAGSLLDFLAHYIRDAPQAYMAEWVHLIAAGDQIVTFSRFGPLSHNHHAEVLAPRLSLAEQTAHLLDAKGNLGNQDAVSSRSDARYGGNPPGMSTHHLHYHDAMMGFRSRVKTIDGLGGYRHCCIKPKGIIGAGQIIIDRLGTPTRRTPIWENLCATPSVSSLLPRS